MRSAMLETARQDYVRTARAKGVPERAVILKHMLRNSLIPMVTILAGILPGLISGSVIIERIFSIPGIGQLGYEAVLARDYPVILALFSASSFLTLLGILLADLALALVDPRISFARSRA
jgi:peptide/nickel transport system permease protein